ncbi:flagellar basal body rod protein FlgB [Planctomicrobium sp. SH668]|uniref:flagellar basal body rod protein FlgB n=1 Tax=Planctomicrobium sp. SH668 TaxID=3448126 RepID=UPI003F5B5EEF
MFPIPPQLSSIHQLMNAAELRQQVISQNLANVNTPGYQRLDVEFEEIYAQHLKEGGEMGTSTIAPRVFQEEGLNTRHDGNNVDVDREIGQLNRNAMLFQTYSQIVASQFDLMRRAIR